MKGDSHIILYLKRAFCLDSPDRKSHIAASSTSPQGWFSSSGTNVMVVAGLHNINDRHMLTMQLEDQGILYYLPMKNE